MKNMTPLIIGGGSMLVLLLVAMSSAGANEEIEETGGLEPDDDDLMGVAMVSGAIPDRPSEFFSWPEFERTKTGLPNRASNQERLRLLVLHNTVLLPLREHVKRQIHITSGFRSEEVNRKVGGSETSRHMTGEAVDFKVDGMTPEAVAATIVKLGLPFDQLIWYGSWVHVGIRVAEGNRGEVFYSPKSKTYIEKRPNAALAV